MIATQQHKTACSIHWKQIRCGQFSEVYTARPGSWHFSRLDESRRPFHTTVTAVLPSGLDKPIENPLAEFPLVEMHGLGNKQMINYPLLWYLSRRFTATTHSPSSHMPYAQQQRTRQPSQLRLAASSASSPPPKRARTALYPSLSHTAPTDSRPSGTALAPGCPPAPATPSLSPPRPPERAARTVCSASPPASPAPRPPPPASRR